MLDQFEDLYYPIPYRLTLKLLRDWHTSQVP